MNIFNPSNKILLDYRLVFEFQVTGLISLVQDGFTINAKPEMFESKGTRDILILLLVFGTILLVVSIVDIRKG